MLPDQFPRIISVACQKGGSCKTTTSLNLAAGFARKGKRVLLIDLDPQGDLTLHCGHNPDLLGVSMYDVLNEAMPIQDVVRSTTVGCDIAPASLELQSLEIEKSFNNHRAFLLRDMMYEIRSRYDYIVIDTPPAMSLLTYNALMAAGEVVIPMLCEPFSLRGMGRLLRLVKEMQRRSRNPWLELAAVVASRYDRRKRLTQQAYEMICGMVPDGTHVVLIRENVSVAEASGMQRDVLGYAPSSNGAEDFARLTEVMLRDDAKRRVIMQQSYARPEFPPRPESLTQYLAV